MLLFEQMRMILAIHSAGEEGWHSREEKKNDKRTEMKTMLKNIIYVEHEHEHEQDSCVK